MQIAIFGGSFDPVHIGHEAVVNEALKTLNIEKLYVVPTYLNPFKKSFFLDEKSRFQLVEKLFCDEKKVVVSDFEIRQKRAVPTIQTVEYLKNITSCSKIYLIIGEDNLDELHLWNSIDKLKKMVTFCIATRGEKKELQNEFLYLDIDVDVSSTNIRKSWNISQIPNKIRDDLEEILRKR